MKFRHSVKWHIGAGLLAISVTVLGCDSSAISTGDHVSAILALVEQGTPESITEAYNRGEQLAPPEAAELVARADERFGPHPGVLNQALSAPSNRIPVRWKFFPLGLFPYSATSAYGVCGQDTDLIARYSNAYYGNFSALYFETNNAVTYSVALAHGLSLTAYEQNPQQGRVSVCAGLGPLAGLPIVRNQLASLFLDWTLANGQPKF